LLVDEFLSASAEQLPEKTALVCGAERLSYRDLDEASRRLAGALLGLGFTRGDRVVIHLENSTEAVLSVFATLTAGGVFVPVNPGTKAQKLAYILNDCAATVLITDMRAANVVEEISLRVPTLKHVVFVGGGDLPNYHGCRVSAFAALACLPATDSVSARSGIDLDLAAIVYTSGSTGVPKGVMLSHRNIVAAATSITGYLESRADDVVLNVLPLSFDYGLYQLLMTFKVGGTLILDRSFAYPPLILQTLVRERVTGFPVVPTIVAILVRHELSSYDLSSLRYITSTGALLPASHIAALRKTLPNVRIYSMYGITEAKRVSFLPPEEIDARPDSVGKPMDNVEVFVVDADGRPQRSGIGELIVRGANVMQGYWGQPEDSAHALPADLFPGERVLRTGDLFNIDDEGYLYFIARMDDVIKSRGEKVSPREIENVLHALPGIAEAAVIGIPDPVLGQTVKAFLRPSNGHKISDIDVIRHCAQHLEDLLIPRVIEFVAEMPRSFNGKVDKKALELHSRFEKQQQV
jgi:amino acid adenylation domain-containing protein